MNDDDSELIARIATGDEEAFEAFYRRHVDAVVAGAVRRCRDAHEVTELCAAVFLAVWQRAATFDAGRGEVGAWLYGIATHRLIDLRRGDRRRTALAARLIERRVLDGDDIERLTERIDAERDAGNVIGVVRDLPEPQREALSLVAVDGLTATEAAEQLGSTPTAVRMRLSRARRTVRARLADEATTSTTTTTVLSTEVAK